MGIQPPWALLWSCSSEFGADSSESPFLAGLAEIITPHLNVCVKRFPLRGLISGQVCILNSCVLLQKMHQQHSKGTFQRRKSNLDPPFPPECSHSRISVAIDAGIVLKERIWALLSYTRRGSWAGESRKGEEYYSTRQDLSYLFPHFLDLGFCSSIRGFGPVLMALVQPRSFIKCWDAWPICDFTRIVSI